MSLKTGSQNNIVARINFFVRRSFLIILFVISFGLMLIGKADNIVVEKSRAFISDLFVPVFKVIAFPAEIIGSVLKNLKDLAFLRKENNKLRKENEVLRELLEYTVKISKEHDQLAALNHFVPPPDAVYFSAEVIADMSGAYGQNMIVLAGRANGIKKGQIVADENGIVGRIAFVGERTSRLVSLTDITSRVPVMVDGTDVYGILAGDNSAYPSIINIDNGKTLQPGSRIVTSSRAGVYPSGIPVGVVLPFEEGDVIKVKTYSNISKLNIVKIIDYSLTGILPEECKTNVSDSKDGKDDK